MNLWGEVSSLSRDMGFGIKKDYIFNLIGVTLDDGD